MGVTSQPVADTHSMPTQRRSNSQEILTGKGPRLMPSFDSGPCHFKARTQISLSRFSRLPYMLNAHDLAEAVRADMRAPAPQGPWAQVPKAAIAIVSAAAAVALLALIAA